jgi:hypothetical protein
MTEHLAVREMTKDELDGVSGGASGVSASRENPSLEDLDAGTHAPRPATMFLRRVWRDGALFGVTPVK